MRILGRRQHALFMAASFVGAAMPKKLYKYRSFGVKTLRNLRV
jgi:hypothetical protein